MGFDSASTVGVKVWIGEELEGSAWIEMLISESTGEFVETVYGDIIRGCRMSIVCTLFFVD